MQLQDVGLVPPSLSLQNFTSTPKEPQLRDVCPIPGNLELGP